MTRLTLPLTNLHAALCDGKVLKLPGVHDALSARLVVEAGFSAAFVSGAGISFARLGHADLAFLSLSDMVDAVRAMYDASGLLLLVDIDTGYGNALNTAHAVRALERVGAAGVQIEDQTAPKRCGHLAGKQIVPIEEMVGKISAACDARDRPQTLVVARTDALAVTGLKDALARGEAYIKAGADALFIEAPPSLDAMIRIAERFAGRVPLVHNFVEGPNSPITTMADLANLGYQIGLFPLACLHAAVPSQRAILSHLAQTGQTQDWPHAKADLYDINAIVMLNDLMEKALTFAPLKLD